MMDPDELEKLGLYDPEAEHAQERLAYVQVLLDLGASVDDLQKTWRPYVLSWNLAVRPGPPKYTVAEAAQKSGLPEDVARRVWRAAGLPETEPDAVAFADADLEVLQTVALSISILGDSDALLELVRVIGSSLSRITEAAGSLYVSRLSDRFTDDPEGAKLARFDQAFGAELLPRLGRALEVLLRQQMLAAGNREIDPSMIAQGYETRDMAVGFADLVGSTAHTRGASITEVGDIYSAFEDIAFEAIQHEGARVVKLIGDEVMFASLDPTAACEIALQLIDAADGHSLLPALRAGVGAGEVINRDGDCFGPVVTLASRTVDVAEPGTAYVTPELQQRVLSETNAYVFRSVGRRTLRGFEDPVEMFDVTRSSQDG